MAVARFHVSNISPDVNEPELYEALTDQLGLEDVTLLDASLADAGDGTQIAEVELPDAEADLLRGPYREAKVYIRRTLILRFAERQCDGASSSNGRASGAATSGGARLATVLEEGASLASGVTKSTKSESVADSAVSSSRPFLEESSPLTPASTKVQPRPKRKVVRSAPPDPDAIMV
eukprot:TRINITY_DN18281_c0_g1_i1.p1 TRINITY_DN18281_c0_g1~~TRINITY_DN18281_c0_g1_i1.p1  ORF type:complete len:177 (-),score=35.76 TRINITY_DN18281_c0_g1_i1:57-587(-)